MYIANNYIIAIQKIVSSVWYLNVSRKILF